MTKLFFSFVLLAQVSDPALWDAYNRSISDSAVYRRENVRQLHPLKADADGYVFVTTLTPRDGKVGGTIHVGGQGMWVTAVPEVQTICRAFRGDIILQLNELLGLPPDNNATIFLELKANADDLFRPSPDPTTTTTYPCTTASDATIPNDCGNAFPMCTTPAHYQWIATQTMSLHKIPKGYPWTHLGYTYNWAPGKDRYGASEYVLRPGSTVTIVARALAVDYCAPNPTP